MGAVAGPRTGKQRAFLTAFPMSDRPDIRIEMLSNPLYLSGARELVGSVARRLGFSELACGQIALAVDEALCNIIRHGYDRRPDGLIWLSLWPVHGENGSPGGLKIVLEDEARQIDPSAIRGRDLDDVKPGGLGVHIIREVMDEARYEKRDGHGMKLTMVKKIGPDGSGPERSGPGGLDCGCGGGSCVDNQE